MGRTIVCGRYEWDEEKNRTNIRKHGISFEEVLPMFDDPLFWERYDESHSDLDENRYIGMARLGRFTVLVTVYVERERTRIISARVSTKEEERRYERWCRRLHP